MVQKHLPLLELLAGSTDAQRSAILKTLTKPQLRAMLEAIYNVLGGNCSVKERDRNKLFRYRSVIRRLVSKELSPIQQRRLLNKYRVLLPLLLKPAIELWKNVNG